MTRYFAQNTPRAGLEHMMMSVPGFQKRGGGMMILSRFCYKPEDVDCRYCLHYRRRSCQVRTCPYKPGISVLSAQLPGILMQFLHPLTEDPHHIPVDFQNQLYPVIGQLAVKSKGRHLPFTFLHSGAFFSHAILLLPCSLNCEQNAYTLVGSSVQWFQLRPIDTLVQTRKSPP